jgi:CRP/FNR family transcriptional regulator
MADMKSNNLLDKLQSFSTKFSFRQYAKGETILNAEEDPPGIFYLQEGFVRFYSLSPEGKELTLNIFKPGSFFPMTWAVAERPNVYFFEAITAAKLRLIPKNKLLEFLQNEPELLFQFTQRILIGLDGLLTRMEYLLFGNASQRVTSVLLMSARRFGQEEKNGEVKIDFPLTHQSIANLAGLTRESTSLEMKKLENTGLISSKNRRITLIKPEKLKDKALLYRDEEPLPYTF